MSKTNRVTRYILADSGVDVSTRERNGGFGDLLFFSSLKVMVLDIARFIEESENKY